MLDPRILFGYFRIYQKYIGKRLALVFLLAVLAVLVEAFGITLVLPLLTSLEMGAESGSKVPGGFGAWVQKIVNYLGLGGSTVGIIAFIAVLVALKGVIRFCADAYGSILTAQLQREIKRKMFIAYAGMDYRYYSAYNTGHFVNIINAQITKLVHSFQSFKTFVVSLLTTFGYLAVAFLVDWRFALMAGVFGGGVLLLFRKLNSYVRDLSRKTASESGVLNKFLVQCMQSYKYVASTATMAPLSRNVFRSVDRLTAYARNQGLAGAFTGAIREPVSIMVILLVLVIQIQFFQASIAAILVSLILLYRAMGQIMLLQSTWQQMMNEVGSLEIVEAEFEKVGAAQELNGRTVLAPFSRGIQLKGVRFRYQDDGEEILQGIDLDIRSAQTVALVGPSGAGKSTLVDLVTLLLRPTEGELWIDGVDASTVDLASWRRQIGYVSQETIIFDDTIANNICMWTGDYGTDTRVKEAVHSAAQSAAIFSFIESLPDGFNTIVGDRGIRLSGGQKQRLFIAREIFKQPKLLILDEATSALDSESEQAIQQSIDQLKGQTTIIIIAHRLSTVKNADSVYLLEAGRVVERGTYKELIATSDSRFARMVAAQTLAQQGP